MSALGSPPFAGHCACGAIHFELTANPLFVHCCHCTSCQRETGSAFAINALIESSEVRLTKGEIEWRRIPSASGAGQVLATCGHCRTVLWSHYSAAKDRVAFIRVGALEEGHGIEPDIHIYTRSKVPWVEIPRSITSVPEFYRRSEHWSEESILRYKSMDTSIVDRSRFEMKLCCDTEN